MTNLFEQRAKRRATLRRYAQIGAGALIGGALCMASINAARRMVDQTGAKIARTIWKAMNQQQAPDFSRRKEPI